MAQVKLLKIASDGVPVEFGATDDITLATFTAGTGGPVLSSTGLDLQAQALTDASSVQVSDPTVGFLNQTAGNLIFDNIVGKERANVFTTAGDISFPVITDTAGEVDAFRLPALAGAPTATPTSGGEGHTVWDSTNNRMYVWTGAAWADQTVVSSTLSVQTPYTAGAGGTAARDVVYVSAADTVLPAIASAAGTSQAVGLGVAAAAAAATVQVQENGVLTGFSGLTAGARYYLSGSVAGAVTSTIPATSGHTIVQIGYAKSATAMHIHIEQMGRRA